MACPASTAWSGRRHAQIGDDANLLWELPSLPGRVFSVDITQDGRIIAAGSSLDGHGNVNVYRMDPSAEDSGSASKQFSTSQCRIALLPKPQTLHKHFEQGVKTLAQD